MPSRSAVEVKVWRDSCARSRQEKGQRLEQQQSVGVAASWEGEDNQGGAELSGALKEATRGMNLTLQLRHTQHCFAIVSVYYTASDLKFYFLNTFPALENLKI